MLATLPLKHNVITCGILTTFGWRQVVYVVTVVKKKREDFSKTKFPIDSCDLLALSNTESSKQKEHMAN